MSEFTLQGSNKELYQQEAERLRCPRYWPCPICHKCRHKASALHLKCQKCSIPKCAHKESDREFMIRRENFSPKFGMQGG